MICFIMFEINKNIKMKDYIIIMADIIDSRNSDQKNLMNHFKHLTKEVNHSSKQRLLSPITITLGDEFQGIAEDVESAVKLIFDLEEKIIQQRAGFKLRYVIFEGAIDTPINKLNAYEMLGEGLTHAREALDEYKSSDYRCYFHLKDKKKSDALTHSLFVYQSIIDEWKVQRDYDLISNFITLKDYKKVADESGKTRSQIWKREKSLKIKEYFSCKSLINYVAER